MIYKVYVLYAPEHDRLFTGMTSSLSDRMVSHNGDEPEDWTTVYKPWTLVHMELFNNEDEALHRETFLESPPGQDYVRSDILPLFNFN
ncbi:MAG: GIY-YIG nuclease family protein [Bacteroidales bacterium]|nr:GIY-YIG nuclease family protein [Bacteroidales bacterium]